MKNQFKKFIQYTVALFLLVLLTSSSVLGQDNLDTDGGVHTISYLAEVQDFVVPINSEFEYLVLEARGADGGVLLSVGNNITADGGEGALLSAAFKLGNDGIPLGSTIRFITGGNGGTKGNGGGGTGIAYKDPGGSWTILMVAGGGGGGGPYSAGQAGRKETSGGKGKDYDKDNGGKNGGHGARYPDSAGPGLGINDSFDNDGNPIGSKEKGSFGFGGGGEGKVFKAGLTTTYKSGGGGGGYSGGGGGKTDDQGGGGGGGSYFAESALDESTTINDKTEDPKAGHASYQFTNFLNIGEINYAASEVGEKLVGSIRPFIHQDLCIDNAGGKTTNGNKIQLWNCGGAEGNNNQKWFFDGDKIRLSNHRGKCLNLSGNDSSNGTDLQLYTCKEGSTSQQWIYDQPSQTIRLKRDINKCIHAYTSNSATVQIWDCLANNSNMQFILEEATPNPEDEVFGAIKLTSNTNNCIDLKSGNISNGANIQSYPCNGTIAQTWYVEGDQIRIDGRDNYCLSLKSGDAHDGDDVHIWECKDQDNQAWIFDMTFKLIRSRINANKCLTVINDDIKLATCSFSSSTLPNQQWTLPGGYSERVNGKNLKIHLGKDDNKCIDMANASSGADVRVYDCKNGSAAAAQTFYFDGSRIRRADNHLLCLELEGAKTDVGTDIQLGTCTGSIFSQKWMYDGISGRIHSKADPNKCMDFDHAYTANGTNLKLDDCKVHDAQIFDIK